MLWMELSKGMMYTVCTVNTHKDQSYYSMEEQKEGWRYQQPP